MSLAIETHGLTRHFGELRAVDHLRLQVPSGSVYGFLGPNGAGKTTTIRMLLGLIRPDQGEIRLGGEALTRASRRAVLRRVGALVEAPSLYPHLTGFENLRVTQTLLAVPRTCIERVLQIVHLQRDGHRLVQTYSQGMRQRLALALTLLAEPELLILDEPTNGLDPAGIHEIRDLLRRLPVEQRVTIFLSSHLLAEVEHLASHVGIIGRGRLLFEGTLADLQQRHPQERVIVEVNRPAVALDVLRQAGAIVEHVEGSVLTIDFRSREEIARAAAAMVNAGVSLYQLRTTRPTLEELFLELTKGTTLGATPATEAWP